MRNYDLTPVWRSSLGLDRFLKLVDAPTNAAIDYPVYDVERTGDDQYRISLALAGFAPEEVAVTAEPSKLTVEGRKANNRDGNYLYQGISLRPFRRVFSLEQYIQVKDVTFESGVLRIFLVREVPEAMRPRRIPIGIANNDNQKNEQKQAA